MTMSNAAVTIVGRAGTQPQVSVAMTGDRVNFRVIANERWFDKANDKWVDGDEFGVTVVCWKTLATSVLTSVRKGDPVIVGGRIATRRFEKNGVTQYFTEVRADFVGLDVAKVASRFTRIPPEPRESADPNGAANDAVIVDGLPAEPERGEPEFDPRPPWDINGDESSGRDGELVSVD
jgi:single-strand DNA-binding protein